MSIEEIEQAITGLSPSEVDSLAEWIARFRARASTEIVSGNGHELGPSTLADAMGDLIGVVGHDKPGPATSSRNAGHEFTDHLMIKKQENRL